MTDKIRIPHEVADQLGYYVYALRDPRDGEVFYVGKGKGDRINAHVREAGKDPQSERAKLQRIHEIEHSGHEVDLVMIRHGIPNEGAAFMVEQSVIDGFAASHHDLTNLVRGHDSGTLGLASLPAVIARYVAPPCPPIDAPVIMVKIQRDWRPDMTEAQVFGQTRGHWRISEHVRERTRTGYCLGVAYGVVRGAYRVDSWFRSQMPSDQGKNRWGFEGEPAEELAHVVGTEVRGAFPNQVMYRQFLTGYPGSSGAAGETSQ